MQQKPTSTVAVTAAVAPSHAATLGHRSRMDAVLSGISADSGHYRPLTQVMRALRRVRLFAMPRTVDQLAASPSFAAHVAGDGERDPVFYLSHRHYLAKGLGSKARAEAALCHYLHEDRTFAPEYHDMVYRRGGLVLWSADREGHVYDIVLQPGRDVAYEGGLSVALRVDGAVIGVLSFSLVPTALFGAAHGLPETIHLVCRRHLTRDRAYQADYNKAFHRVSAPHMMFAALEGLILAQGRRHALGIAPNRHPSDHPALNPYFRDVYVDFWSSLGGESQPDLGYLIALPMRLSPLDDLDSAKRKRALQRRGHLEVIRQSARDRIVGLLVQPETA